MTLSEECSQQQIHKNVHTPSVGEDGVCGDCDCMGGVWGGRDCVESGGDGTELEALARTSVELASDERVEKDKLSEI